MTKIVQPSWFKEIITCELPAEGKKTENKRTSYITTNGILRAMSAYTPTQSQTENVFGFKWKKRDTFESAASLKRMKEWLIQRYGDVPNANWWNDHPENPIVLDAGCGAGMSGIELFGTIIPKLKYLCADISPAVDIAASRMAEHNLSAGFIQSDIADLPLKPNTIDIIFSEGVLHHTDSTKNAILGLSKLLKPGGRFLFYVYKKKGPLREFSDDYIRNKIQNINAEEAWDKMLPITHLGKTLGELDIDIDIPSDIDLLDIPKGKISIQRLFYWHILKCFYHKDLSIEEMNHINFDWYAPANAHRQTPEEVSSWCEEAGLIIEREVIEDAGITIRARKPIL